MRNTRRQEKALKGEIRLLTAIHKKPLIPISSHVYVLFEPSINMEVQWQ
jgi:hypothetical protein